MPIKSLNLQSKRQIQLVLLIAEKKTDASDTDITVVYYIYLWNTSQEYGKQPIPLILKISCLSEYARFNICWRDIIRNLYIRHIRTYSHVNDGHWQLIANIHSNVFGLFTVNCQEPRRISYASLYVKNFWIRPGTTGGSGTPCIIPLKFLCQVRNGSSKLPKYIIGLTLLY